MVLVIPLEVDVKRVAFDDIVSRSLFLTDRALRLKLVDSLILLGFDCISNAFLASVSSGRPHKKLYFRSNSCRNLD